MGLGIGWRQVRVRVDTVGFRDQGVGMGGFRDQGVKMGGFGDQEVETGGFGDQEVEMGGFRDRVETGTCKGGHSWV